MARLSLAESARALALTMEPLAPIAENDWESLWTHRCCIPPPFPCPSVRFASDREVFLWKTLPRSGTTEACHVGLQSRRMFEGKRPGAACHL